MFGLFRKKVNVAEEMAPVVIKRPVKGPVQPIKCDASFPGHLIPFIDSNYPHIMKTLPLFWGTDKFQEYMHKLLINDDGRVTRKGFPFPAMVELTQLVEWHDKVFPHYRPKADPWDEVKEKK